MTSERLIGYSDHMPANHLPRLTDERLEDIAAAYGSGMSIRALAFERGMSYGAMHRRIKVAESLGLTKVRGRGARTSVITTQSG